MELNSIIKTINEELGINLFGILMFNNNDIVLASDIPDEVLRFIVALINIINRARDVNQVKVRARDFVAYITRSDELVIVFLANPSITEGALTLLNYYISELIRIGKEYVSKAKAIEPMITVEGDALTEEDLLILIDYFKSKLRELESRGG